jgi:glycosyltransferase involved in cell wall biosynthesis
MKSASLDFPKISIITVVLNGKDYIEDTIKSVIGQTYQNIEYIVIDGGSTDGTIDIIKNYKEKIDYWHSKNDDGIYDAMNSGLVRATGSWVNFMNAGDVFHTSDTVSEIFGSEKQNACIIYGAVEILYEDFSRIQEPGFPNLLWQGMQFSHQSAFIDVKYHQSHPFNIQNKLSADLAFLYQAYESGVTFSNCNRVVSRVITGGVSEVNRLKTILSSCYAICGNRFRPFIRLFYLGRIINTLFRMVVKFCLPRFVVKKVILLK